MRLISYVLLMFSIAVVLYAFGYRPALMYMYSSQGSSYMDIQCNTETNPDCVNSNSILNMIGSGVMNQMGVMLAALLGVSIATAIAGGLFGGSSFTAVYILPLAIAMVILNFMVFPTSMLFEPGFPTLISIPLVVLFNILGIAAVTGFVRGQI